MLYQICVCFEGNIRVTRFGVKVHYKHIHVVVTAQINLKDYYFYSFPLILIKLVYTYTCLMIGPLHFIIVFGRAFRAKLGQTLLLLQLLS